MAEMIKSFPAGEGTEMMPSPVGRGPNEGNVAAQAKDMVSGQVARRAEQSANDLSSVARALRQTREQLGDNIAAPVVDKAADQLERLSRFLRTAEPRQMVYEVESFARREPLIFLGGAFALGMLGARFLKSSTHRGEMWRGSRYESGSWEDERRRREYAATGWGSNTGPRGAGERAGTGAPDVGATAPDPRGDYPPNTPPGGPYPGSGKSNADRQDRERRS